MLNATRIAAVTAILAVGGSFLYLGGNLGPSSVPGAAPGAEITEEAVGAARVTGTVGAIEDSFSEVEYLPDRSVQREYTTTYLNQMSDARLSGRGTGTNYLETIQTDAGVFLSHSSSGELENDGGTWTLSCTGAGLETPEGIDGYIPCWYVGEGGYEGLTALVVLGDFDGTIWQAEGWVFPGDPPPME